MNNSRLLRRMAIAAFISGFVLILLPVLVELTSGLNLLLLTIGAVGLTAGFIWFLLAGAARQPENKD